MIEVGQKYKRVKLAGEFINVGEVVEVLRIETHGAVVRNSQCDELYIPFPFTSLWELIYNPSHIYLAHPISNTYEAEASIKTAQLLRDKGFTVYAAAENASINDKLNNPTPRDIFKADCDKIKECDVFVVNITGGMQDGTLFEVGYAAALGKRIIAYSTNARLANPQHWNGIPSASANHLVLGAIDTWCNSLEEVLHVLQS